MLWSILCFGLGYAVGRYGWKTVQSVITSLFAKDSHKSVKKY